MYCILSSIYSSEAWRNWTIKALCRCCTATFHFWRHLHIFGNHSRDCLAVTGFLWCSFVKHFVVFLFQVVLNVKIALIRAGVNLWLLVWSVHLGSFRIVQGRQLVYHVLLGITRKYLVSQTVKYANQAVTKIAMANQLALSVTKDSFLGMHYLLIKGNLYWDKE